MNSNYSNQNSTAVCDHTKDGPNGEHHCENCDTKKPNLSDDQQDKKVETPYVQHKDQS